MCVRAWAGRSLGYLLVQLWAFVFTYSPSTLSVHFLMLLAIHPWRRLIPQANCTLFLSKGMCLICCLVIASFPSLTSNGKAVSGPLLPAETSAYVLLFGPQPAMESENKVQTPEHLAREKTAGCAQTGNELLIQH